MSDKRSSVARAFGDFENPPFLARTVMMVLYADSARVDGRDLLKSSLIACLQGTGARTTYKEIDPDVFAEELEAASYSRADRIAAVAVSLQGN